MSIDAERIAAVKALETLGFAFENGGWQPPLGHGDLTSILCKFDKLQGTLDALLSAQRDPAPHQSVGGGAWQSPETAPKTRPIAIKYKSHSGWRVTGAEWAPASSTWMVPFGHLQPSSLAGWQELPEG